MHLIDFSEALRLMREQRHKVKRAHWKDRCLFLLGDRFYCRFDDDDSAVEWTPITMDLLACDWRVELLEGEGVEQKLPLVWA